MKAIFKVFLLVLILSLSIFTGCSKSEAPASGDMTVPTQTEDTATPTDPSALLADSFERADSETVGDLWQEVRMRNGTGNSIPVREEGDTPWGIKGNALSYEGTGNNTYTEDFIQTVNEYPIENVMVEFEMRGTIATTLGYVGPGFFWAPTADNRLGGFGSSDETQQLIGVQAFYGWESNGTKGMAFKLGGSTVSTQDVMLGINQEDFVKQTIVVKEGKMTYKAGDGPEMVYDLTALPETGAMRHLSFDVRYYDNGVPFKVEIKNLKVTQL
jgi:hypothetical protein